ncbi:MBL fold metallo-hydrolase [Thalassobacillus hwangdonensis]|uniref:MBL fold metallo-hydrolase n=1 Tax=Thalassobacillus hwangdonensis TaxID=546108 RepID=A0ABW3KXM7_9BACI
MNIEFLGTGGAMSIPRPLCTCKVCIEAREKGVPYSRTGPSIFLHGPDLLIDTPEDSYVQINRSTIREINGVLYSHWHPDHVMGRRVVESISADWRNHPPENDPVDVFLPEQVHNDFDRFLGSGDHFNFFKEQGYATVHKLSDDENIQMSDTTIYPFRLAESYVYGFLIENDGRNVLIIMDELNNWQPPEFMKNIDVAILPAGIFDVHPLTGEILVSPDHPVLKEEATFKETVEVIEKLGAKEVYLTHIEEVNGLSHDTLKVVEEKYAEKGIRFTFAYDTQIISI